MLNLAREFYRDQDGATALEYGLIAALVSVASIVALSQLGNSLIGVFTELSTQMDTAGEAAEGASP